MNIIAFCLVVYGLLMLTIHVSTSGILKAWDRPESWASRWFPPRRALRTEGLFWVLALGSWSLWQSLAWKVVLVAFAVIHLAIWVVSEFAAYKGKGTGITTTTGLRRLIIAFDSLETVVLIGIGIVAISYLMNVR